MTSSDMRDKPFKIDKWQVYEAYKAVNPIKARRAWMGRLLNSSSQI